jgi:hypothetical protein
MYRRSASALVVRELQAKVDKGENIEFELQVCYHTRTLI